MSRDWLCRDLLKGKILSRRLAATFYTSCAHSWMTRIIYLGITASIEAFLFSQTQAPQSVKIFRVKNDSSVIHRPKRCRLDLLAVGLNVQPHQS